jgi:hypothetical protein
MQALGTWNVDAPFSARECTREQRREWFDFRRHGRRDLPTLAWREVIAFERHCDVLRCKATHAGSGSNPARASIWTILVIAPLSPPQRVHDHPKKSPSCRSPQAWQS